MAGDVLAERTKKLRRKLRKLEELDGQQLHKLRVAIKKLHYGAEFFCDAVSVASRQAQGIRGAAEGAAGRVG